MNIYSGSIGLLGPMGFFCLFREGWDVVISRVLDFIRTACFCLKEIGKSAKLSIFWFYQFWIFQTIFVYLLWLGSYRRKQPDTSDARRLISFKQFKQTYLVDVGPIGSMVFYCLNVQVEMQSKGALYTLLRDNTPKYTRFIICRY